MPKHKLLASFPMSICMVYGVGELRKRLRRLPVHPARRRGRFAGSCCPAGAHAERRSIDERTCAECSELMAVMVLDDTAAGRGCRSP